jgi:hypothetical protein
MQISKLVLAILLSNAGLTVISAQTTPAQQNRALEVLRQKIAEEKQKAPAPAPAVTNPGPTAPAKAPEPKVEVPVVEEKKEATPAKPAEESETPAQKRALEAVRKALEQDKASRASSAKPSRSPAVVASPAAIAEPKIISKPVTTAKEKKPEVKKKPGTASVQKTEAAETTPAAPIAEIPAGPKTKQQRLAELLDNYNADKITPQQYHEERAKIVAEP